MKLFNIEDVYKPSVRQQAFHSSKAKYRLYGGAVGGGKTHAIIFEAIGRSLAYDFPVAGAIFRRSFPELDSTIVRKMQEILPPWMYKYNQQKHVLTFANGSTIDFGYAETDGDVTRYQSREWDWLAIDELTHFTQYKFTYLMTRVRTTKPLETRFFAGTNPGDIGHVWVKQRWIDKDSKENGYDPDEYEFISAKIQDNKFIMDADPNYIKQLEMLPENQKRALLYGDWNVFEGQFFEEWDESRHVVTPFTVPANWKFFMSMDDGTRAPRSAHVWAVDNDLRVWCVWEYYRKGEVLPDAANNMKESLKNAGLWDKLEYLVVDPSMKRANDQTGISGVEILEGMGFGFKFGEVKLGNNKRVDGWKIVKSYLSHKPYEEPMLKFFSSCENIVRTLPSQIYYSGRNSKKEDLDTTQEDHCLVGETMVRLLSESVPIKDLVGTSGEVITLGGIKEYSNVLKTGHKKVLEITFDDNSSIRATPEHPILNSKFGWQSIKDFSVGDKVLDFRPTDLIQSDTYESKDNKQNNSGIFWNKVLQVWRILSAKGCKASQACLGEPLWRDKGWLSYTSQGWESTQQLDRKSGIIKSIPTSFLSFKEFNSKGKEKAGKTSGYSKAINKEMACFGRGAKMAQCTRERNLGKDETYKQGMSVLWEGVQNEITWRLKVLSSKLQSKSNEKTVTGIKEIGYRDVYNLHINDVHCFMTDGGTIVHNSADDCRYGLMSLEVLPSRFEGGRGKEYEVTGRKYSPISK